MMFSALFLLLLTAVIATENLKFVHQYKNSLGAPFYYPPESKDIPSYTSLGDVSFMAKEKVLRLSSELKNSNGAVWLNNPVSVNNWRVVVNFRMHSRARTGGNGLAFWFTKEQGKRGSLFGSQSRFNGYGIFLDSQPKVIVTKFSLLCVLSKMMEKVSIECIQTLILS